MLFNVAALLCMYACMHVCMYIVVTEVETLRTFAASQVVRVCRSHSGFPNSY